MRCTIVSIAGELRYRRVMERVWTGYQGVTKDKMLSKAEIHREQFPRSILVTFSRGCR